MTALLCIIISKYFSNQRRTPLLSPTLNPNYRNLLVMHQQDILGVTRVRKFETKLGEQVLVAADPGNISLSIEKSPAEYILIGIPEDIGVKANEGAGGAGTAWIPFLQSFLNIQSNDFLTGESILGLGHFDFSELPQLIEANAKGPGEKVE